MKLTKPTIIGPKTEVEFIGLGVKGVPAKIDTGAYTSSIWASNIREEDGKLYFCLFDRQSPFYTGEVQQSKNYSTRLVKNSFGHSEVRYEVRLTVSMEGRSIKSSFTLANRSRNRYPILVGRRTLKGKFIVDVSRYQKSAKTLPVLILSAKATKNAKEKFSELENSKDGKLLIDVARYDELVVAADSEGSTIKIKTNGRDLSSYGMIHFLTRMKNAELAAMVASYAQTHGVAFSDQAAALFPTDTKAHQVVMLAGRGISLPATIYMDRSHWHGSYRELKKQLGSPFIFKDDRGLKGRHNYLIKNAQDFNDAVKQTEAHSLQMIAQKYIPNNGYYRLVVMGHEVVMAMFRNVDTSKSHTFKKSRDGAAKVVDLRKLPGEILQMALNASQFLSLDVAGVDVLQDNQTGEWYCLEVNNSPQLIGGAFVDEKMQALGRFFMQESSR